MWCGRRSPGKYAQAADLNAESVGTRLLEVGRNPGGASGQGRIKGLFGTHSVSCQYIAKWTSPGDVVASIQTGPGEITGFACMFWLLIEGRN